MAYRTIVVYLDNEVRAPALLQVASELARRHSSHLIGMYVKPPLQVYAGAEMAAPVFLVKDHDEYYKEQSAILEKLFEAKVSSEEFVGEWRYISCMSNSVADVVTEIARTADLVIAGQCSDDENLLVQREIPEQILMAANRPIVIVPHDREFQSVGSTVFVAWDGSAAATRAVFDSLPALQFADTVTLHRINPSNRDRHKIRGIPAEMVQTLSRHSVNVELAESDARAGDVGAELLSYVNEKGADLMVMGGYGHSRFRESILGGVTRHVMNNMTVPVLMTH